MGSEAGADQHVTEHEANVYSFLNPSWRPSSSRENDNRLKREEEVMRSLVVGSKTLAAPSSSIKNALLLVKSKRIGALASSVSCGASSRTVDEVMADLKLEEAEKLAIYSRKLETINVAKQRSGYRSKSRSAVASPDNAVIRQNTVKDVNVNASVLETWTDLRRLEAESIARIKQLQEVKKV